MHPLQAILIEMARFHKLDGRTYRQIAWDIHADHGSQAKYHLDRLIAEGVIKKTKAGKFVLVEDGDRKPMPDAPAFTYVPLLGSANCGDARVYAEDRVEHRIPVSTKIIHRNASKWFALLAEGTSMNDPAVLGVGIDDGDYVLVDGSDKEPHDKDIVVSIIDGLANIKMFHRDEASKQVTLVSQSKSPKDHPPILIHEDDVGSYLIAGKVKHVIKQPKTTAYSGNSN